MRYSFVAATLFSGAVLAHISPVNQIADGQVQVQESAPAASVTAAPEVQETKTAYSTQEITITSCGPEVVSCPAKVYTTSYPVVSSAPPASPQETQPAAPVVPAPVESPAPPAETPVVPAPAETCPPPTEVTVTVTVSGTPAPSAPAVPASPESPAVPAVPESPASPSSPASPASPETPAVPETPSSPGSPAVPESPAGTAPPAGTGTGTASPSGTGAPNSPISPPITPYTGSGAATIGASFGVAGLAAMAAIFLA